MPRKGPIQKREVVLDPVYGSALVTQLVNKVLERGKRGTAEHIVYAALDRLKDRTGNEQVAGLKKAIDNIRPQLEVRSRRVVARRIRFRSKSRAGARRRLRFDGSCRTAAGARRSRWRTGSRRS